MGHLALTCRHIASQLSFVLHCSKHEIGDSEQYIHTSSLCLRPAEALLHALFSLKDDVLPASWNGNREDGGP